MEPEYAAWRLVSDAKEIAELSESQVRLIASSLQDARDYINKALEKIRRAA